MIANAEPTINSNYSDYEWVRLDELPKEVENQMAPEARDIFHTIRAQLLTGSNKKPTRQYPRLPVDLAGDPEACAEFEDLCKGMGDLTLWCPDFSKKFYVWHDGSRYGFGAVLTQLNDEGKYVPIYWAATRTDKAQQSYDAKRLELASAHWAVTKVFRKYLLYASEPFELLTDHANLKHTLMNHSDNLQILRMTEDLSEFSFTCRRVPGESNGVADWLSRILLATTPWRDCTVPEFQVNPTSLDEKEDDSSGLDFDSVDLLAKLACGSLENPNEPLGLEPICPQCRILVSTFLNRIMETQQHPRLEDWPVHQKIFSDLHPKCMFGVKQRCLLPVAFLGGQQAQPDQQACPLDAVPPGLGAAVLQMPPAFLAAQGKSTDKGEGEDREYTSPYHAFISKRTRELRAEGFKGNVSAKAVQEWKELQAQQPQSRKPKVGSPPGRPQDSAQANLKKHGRQQK